MTQLPVRVTAFVLVALLGVAIATGPAGATGASDGTGPTADLSERLSGGNGIFIGSATHTDVRKAGYVEQEYAAVGTATSYKPDGAITPDGRWKFAPDTTAPYRTRVLVRRPKDPKRFSGNVVVEWLNVSGGVDADAEWVSLREEIVRRGDAYVGISAQRIGVVGGPVLVKVDVPGAGDAVGKGLTAIDPARYGSLVHPGDGYSFDIFTQVADAVRAGKGMGRLRPKRLIAASESQSAFALVTYYNGVQPLTHTFDGFLVHSRSGASLPLVGPGQYADIAGSLGGVPTIFRTDKDVPVLDIQSESDVLGILNSYKGRQPDNPHFRLWEVAGTAHADQHLVGPSSKYIDCGVPINDGPMHLVVKAGLHALTGWIEHGTAPPKSPRIELTTGAAPQIRRNADGVALGGVRTPPVDVPVVVLSGTPGPNPAVICLLDGSTTPLTGAQIAQLYPSRAAYLRRYKADADATIKAGFVLPADRAALLAYAQPDRVEK